MNNPVSLQDVQFYQNSQEIRERVQRSLPVIGSALALITAVGIAIAVIGIASGSPIGVIGICLASVGGLGVASAVAAGVILHIFNKKAEATLIPKNLYNVIKEADSKEGGKILDKLDAKEFWRFMRYTSEQEDVPESIINAINTQPANNRIARSLLGCKPALIQRLINSNPYLAQEVTSSLDFAVKDFQHWKKVNSMDSTIYIHEFVVKFSPMGETLLLSYYSESDKKEYRDHYQPFVTEFLGALNTRPEARDLVHYISTFA